MVLPISYQGEFVPDRPINPPPSLVPPDQLGTKTGLGDTTYTAWFAPAGAGSVTWGAGPAFILPKNGPEWGFRLQFKMLFPK